MSELPSSRISSCACAQCGRTLDAEAVAGGLGCFHCLLGEAPSGNNGSETSSNGLAPESTRSFQHYEILLRADGQPWELGRGAMGVTYKALDTNLRAPVALKVIHARHSAQPEARARFLREARVAARLRHPNVASVFHYGTITTPAPEPAAAPGLLDERNEQPPPTCFYAMELVEGETLDARLRRAGPLPPAEAVEIALGIAAALEAAEKRGLIHRDLKPANVMLAADHEGAAAVKVIDFGLAKAVRAAEADDAEDTDGPSTRGAFLGTPRFASPEQFDGRPVDSRADIYALGSTLWNLLAGQPPHQGRTPAEVHDYQLHRPLPVAQLTDARVPAPLVALLQRMLAPDPAARPPSVRALREELLACRVRLQSRPARWLPVAALAVVVAASLVIAAVMWSFHSAAPPLSAPLVPELVGRAAQAERTTIAVLPFEDRSPTGGDRDYLAVGIPEEILARLGKIGSLRVVAGNRNNPVIADPVTAGRQLGVTYLLRGSVQSSGDTVRVRVLLLNAADAGAELWAETYTRRRDDVFAVESEIARAVADHLGARFAGRDEQSTAAADTAPTENPAAYDAYLRGIAVTLDPSQDTAALLRAEGYFAEAVRLDPAFAPAWARLAAVRLRGYESGWLDPTPTLLEAIRAAVDTNRRLAPDAGETLLVEGDFQRICRHDPDGAVRLYERARRLLPNSALALRRLAAVARDRGRWAEATDLLEDARQLDPRNARLLTERAAVLVCQRRFPEALRAFDAVLNVRPDHPATLAAQAEIFMAQGDLPAAARLFDRARPAPGDYGLLYNQTTLAWMQRRPERAVAFLADALAHPDSALKPTSVASLRVLLGRSQLLAGDRVAGLATLRAAAAEIETLLVDQPDNAFVLTDLARARAAAGEHAAALAAAERACALVPTERDRMTGPAMEDVLVEVCALVGERERALALLERLTRLNYYGSITDPPLTAATLRLYPAFDSLRGDPRFAQLCADPAPAPRP